MEVRASSRGLLFHFGRERLASLSERLFGGPSRDHESARVRADSSFTMGETIATAAQGDLVEEIFS